MEQLFIIFASGLGGLAVALGAFAAHALKTRLDAYALGVFQTGVQYQMSHALALFAVAWLCGRSPASGFVMAGWLFIAGTVLFSGSLYALALSGVRLFGAVTPIGGLLFLGGWGCLAWTAWRSPLS